MSDADRFEYAPHADAADRALFEHVAADDPFAGASAVTPALVRELAVSKGPDYATAALYVRWLRRSPVARSMLTDPAPPPEDRPHVMIMPGAFHRHHANTGADGARMRKLVEQMGWTCETLRVGSLGSLDQSAGALIEHLERCPAGRIIIVSLSKGSADVATALARGHDTRAFARVLAWVSISGLTLGTPLVDWLRRQWWRLPFVHLLLWMKGLRFREVAELTHAPAGRLSAAPPVPTTLRAIHVLGVPCRKHLRHPWATRAYNRLLPLGPSDGGGILLADAERLPGVVVPVWGADHYLQPTWDVEPVLRNILLHASQSATAASTMPATRSTA